MAKKRQPPDDTALVWSPVAARGNVRKWRLHACGCARRNFPKRTAKKWLEFLELAERYADSEITQLEFEAERARFREGRRPRLTGVSGDFDLALYDSESLSQTWRDVVIAANREYTIDGPDYDLVLPRFQLLQDLIGPDPLPAFDPAWRSDTAFSLALGMYDLREFSAMPILADALQDAGCVDPTILLHCQNPEQFHTRGCWVVDLVLGHPQQPAEHTAPVETDAEVQPRGRRRRHR
ncbi:MAG: hypothetical protein C0467_19890 [Planctomycetaceae bacterium]|nr:hypothetical protein [Planctomycetaceae bacterium]